MDHNGRLMEPPHISISRPEIFDDVREGEPIWFDDGAIGGVIEKAGNLKVSHPRDGERFVKSHIYIAPPDHHLIIEDSMVRLSRDRKKTLHQKTLPLLPGLLALIGLHILVKSMLPKTR